MSIPILNTSTALEIPTSTTVPAFISSTLGSTTTLPVQPGIEVWAFTSTTSCWVAQGANPTASAGAGSTLYVPGAAPLLIDAAFGAKLSVLADSVAGKASLTRTMLVNR